MKVDLTLVRKYNVPGPRYTSYPPANNFSGKVTRDTILSHIADNNQSPRDLSLYFHIPFCQTLCWYCGCNTVITKRQSQSAKYLSYLDKQMDLLGPRLHPDRKVVQLHFGGGTPTFLTPDEIRQLGGSIRSRFHFAEDLEAGIEIDPRRLSFEHIAALRDAGFNRASLGIQDHNPEVQKAVNRLQPKEQTEEVVRWIRKAEFSSLSVDLIYGLPHQTVASFEQTLDDVIALNPDRLAVFSYAHVPWMKPAQKLLQTEFLPSAETKFQLLKLSIEKLTASGWNYIGMDHFAKPTDDLAVAQRNGTLQRNFQGYSTRGGADIYGFGITSISQTENLYWQNEKDLQRFYSALDSGDYPLSHGYELTTEDRIRRTTIMRLMCDMGLDFARMSELLGIDFASHFANDLDTLDDLEADGLLHRTRKGLLITETGRLLIRNIAMRFDAYLPKAGTTGVFSRTI